MRTTSAPTAACGKIELHRERVVLRRAVHGMQMAINVRVTRFSRRRAARHRRRPDAGAGASRSVIDDSAVRQFRPRGNRGRLADVERHLRAAAIAGRQARASRRRGAGVTTRSGRGVRNFWCGGAPAICSIRRTSIRASARSSRGIERFSSCHRHRRHPEVRAACAPRTMAAGTGACHPSRLAEDGSHLRMTTR